MKLINNININELNTGDILLFHHKNNFQNIISSFFSIFTDIIMKVTKANILIVL